MKSLLVLLFSGLKLVKFSKIFLTGGSMLISIFAYALLFGWPYATGFVLLLFCHEMGHYIAAHQRGLNVGAPTFIPFVGAWIELKDQPMNAETEAYVGMAGPFIGTIAALICYFLARFSGSAMLLAVAYSGFFLNLFNLIPVPPLDGGRITAVISRKIWFIGIPLLIAIFFWHPSPLLLIIAIIAAMHLWSNMQNQQEHATSGYYSSASIETRFEYTLLYLGLTVFLAIMTYDIHNMLQTLVVNV